MESSPIPSYTAQNSINEPDDEVTIDELSADQISKSKAKGKLEEEDPLESGYSSEGFSPESDNSVDSYEYDAYAYDYDAYEYDDVYEYDVLQSHFDKLDISTDTEYQIPWLQDSEKTPPIPSSKSQRKRVDPSSTSKFTFHPKTKLSPATRRRSTPFRLVKEQSFTKPVSAQNMPPYNQSQNMPYNEFGSGYNFSHIPYSQSQNMSHNEFGSGYNFSHTPYSQSQNMSHNEFGSGSNFSQITYSQSQNIPHNEFVGSSSGLESLDYDELLKKYESFKNFDTAVDFSDHLYANQNSSITQLPKNWAKRIEEEWRILEKDLPDTIFVRVYETRMDILRAAIIGAQGTPYHDGLFFFDVYFPSSYPDYPPLVKYHSGGLRINPNLCKSGRVCLSLLNTWSGGQHEKWVPGTSTMLQVLVSIQGLILNTKPFFNEPWFAYDGDNALGEKMSLEYNEDTLISSLKTMVYTMNKPPKNFEALVVGHFRTRVGDILMACKAYMEGVQVGCVVRGGVQDVDDEGDNKCSAHFKNSVSSYIKTLVDAFKNIGANEADECLTLSGNKLNARAPPTTPPPPTIAHSLNYSSCRIM